MVFINKDITYESSKTKKNVLNRILIIFEETDIINLYFFKLTLYIININIYIQV